MNLSNGSLIYTNIRQRYFSCHLWRSSKNFLSLAYSQFQIIQANEGNKMQK